VTSTSADTADYTSTKAYTVHGFSTADAVTVAIGGSTLATITAATMTANAYGHGATATTQVPDLASGAYSISATGSISGASATGTYTLTYKPAVQLAGGATAQTSGGVLTQTTITVNSGASGTTTILRTGTGSGTAGSSTGPYGVHGLAASTSYQVTWGIGAGATVLTTFTTNAVGGISGGGIQFAVGSGNSGYHILDIRLASTGADVIFGGTTAGSGAFSSQGWVSGNSCTTSNGQICGYFGDTVFSLTASITPSPSVGAVGTAVSLTGSGLTPSTTYYAWVKSSGASTSGVTYTTAGTYVTTFTSTATGTIPTGTASTFNFPTAPAKASGENATSYTIYVDTSTTGTTNSATFVLQAAASLSPTSTTPGSSVTVTGSGLDAGQTYNVVLRLGASNLVVVAGMTANGVGAATASFTVPASTAPGSYQILLTRTSDGKRALVSPPTLTVSASATGGLTAQTLTSSGAPAEAAVNGQATVSQTFTNTASSSLSVYMWVSVQNAAGQTVGVFLGSATVTAGGSSTIAAALFNLPSGTYTATTFVTTTSGIVVSSTSSTSSFSL